MKLSLLFCIASVAGCATAVAPDEPTPPAASQKEAGAPDAKGPQTPPQHDSGVAPPDTGAPQDPGTDSGGSCSLMINYGAAQCQSCMQSCCAEDNACVGSQDCVDLINCLNGCQPNDSSCIGSCRGQHGTGATLFDAITSCMGAQCSGSCP